MENSIHPNFSRIIGESLLRACSGDTDWFGEGVAMNVYEEKKELYFLSWNYKMFPDDLGEQGLTKMYELFKKELSELMNDVQNEIGDERTKQRQIQLIQKVMVSVIQYRNLKKKMNDE